MRRKPKVAMMSLRHCGMRLRMRVLPVREQARGRMQARISDPAVLKR